MTLIILMLISGWIVMIVSWRRSEVQNRLSKDSVDCNNGLQSYCFLNREAFLLFYEQSFLTHLCVLFFSKEKNVIIKFELSPLTI